MTFIRRVAWTVLMVGLVLYAVFSLADDGVPSYILVVILLAAFAGAVELEDRLPR